MELVSKAIFSIHSTMFLPSREKLMPISVMDLPSLSPDSQIPLVCNEGKAASRL